MFDLLKSIFDADKDTAKAVGLSGDDIRLAEAALMFHVMQSDGQIKDVEREKMNEVLREDFDLTADEIESLVEAARLAENEAIDLFRFTSTLKTNLDRPRRIQIVENLWEMVYADGVVHELEDNVVWRIAELLGIETPDRVAMKQRVKARHAD